MPMTDNGFAPSEIDALVSRFRDGDSDWVKRFLREHQVADAIEIGAAHSLLRAFVARNKGHCYQPKHLEIADLFLHSKVRAFRDAVLADRVGSVRAALQEDPPCLHAEFTAGRGLAQAIHHWKSAAMGRLLIEMGADIAALTSRGDSPLGMQARFGTRDGMEQLLIRGADPNRGVDGHFPSADLVERVELLLAHGWRIENAPLLHDANQGLGKRIQIWLRYGADPNVANDSGQTALHLLAARGSGRDAILALIQAGADCDARDASGQRPMDLARRASLRIAERTLAESGQ